jgi:hypothetical protein
MDELNMWKLKKSYIIWLKLKIFSNNIKMISDVNMCHCKH